MAVLRQYITASGLVHFLVQYHLISQILMELTL